jgi:serine/threonine protein kinase
MAGVQMASGEADVGRDDQAKDAFVGTVVNGRFHIVERIARGGMASVYFATQVPLSRPVAIKVVRCVDAGSEEDFRRRFLREASILAQLQHPNIVTLLDYGPITDRSEEHYFMAMEYLRGETLAKRFRRSGRLSIEESIRIARQIGRGLREAHRRGFIHRDLKPSNIMLVPEDDKNDIVKLVDFGIGKIVATRTEVPVNSDSEEMTRVGLLLGSPRYMSPEQIRSEPVELRTDLYGLGVILFQALTGRLPFEGRTEVEVLIAHCSVSPPELSDVCPDRFYPESLSRLVRSLLEKQAKNRPTVEEFLEQLAGIEEEVFGNVSLAGPTLQGTGLVPPSLRAATPKGLFSQNTSQSSWSLSTEVGMGEMDVTPALATALPPVSQPVSRRTTRIVTMVGASILLLVGVLVWFSAKPSSPGTRVVSAPGNGPDIASIPSPAGSSAGAPNLPTLAVTRALQAEAIGVPGAEPASFTLHIDSVPSEATVSEDGKLVGVTPMALTIERRSVSSGPRRFLVKHEGYAPFTLEQGDSKTTVQASAALAASVHTGNDRARRFVARRAGYGSSASPAETGFGLDSKRAGGPALEIRTRR